MNTETEIEKQCSFFERLGYRIECILSTGRTSPVEGWYDQNEHEFVLLLQGEATLEFENDKKVTLRAGDHLNVLPHELHKVGCMLPPTSVASGCIRQ